MSVHRRTLPGVSLLKTPTITLGHDVPDSARRAISDLGIFAKETSKAVDDLRADVEPLVSGPVPLSIDAIRDQLQSSGGHPINVSNLIGVLAQPQVAGVKFVTSLPPASSSLDGMLVNLNGSLYALNAATDPGTWVPLSAIGTLFADTHANRLLNFPPANYNVGTMFWETDRVALYRVALVGAANQWVLLMSRPLYTSLAGVPTLLGTNDAGFLVEISDNVIGAFTQRWTGTKWVYHRGYYRNSFANRPALADCDPGFLFTAYDYGDQWWYAESSANWTILPGMGGPMYGQLNPDTRPVGLGVLDAGFLFKGTDIQQLYFWDGAAWRRELDSPPWGCQLYNSADISMADGVLTTLTWDTEGVDVGGLHSGSSSRITLPTPFGGGNPSGWMLTAQVAWEAAGTGVYRGIAIWKNGVSVAESLLVGVGVTHSTVQQCAFTDINPADGDYYEVLVQQSSGGALNVLHGAELSFFHAIRIF